MKKSHLLCILFLSAIQFMNAQAQPKEIVDRFFSTYADKGSSLALDELYSTNKWMERATDAITNLKSQMDGLNEDYVGTWSGYELIAEKKLTDSYVLLSYLVKFERQPIRYTFQFYKPKEAWVIYSFKFDATIDDEIEEAAKLYYQNLE